MDRERLFDLVVRVNEIRAEQNKLEIEYNMILQEMWKMIPSLKDDPNFQPMQKVKRR